MDELEGERSVLGQVEGEQEIVFLCRTIILSW